MRILPFATLLLAAAATAAPPEKTGPPPAPAAETPAEKPPDKPPSIADRVRDIPRRDGFLPFYWDARKGQLLLEVSRWNEEFLYGAGIAGGAGTLDISLDRGQLGDLGICRFERSGPRVLLHQRQMVHRVNQPGETARVAEESFPSAVLASLPIVAEEGDRVLADATAFLLADTAILPSLKEAKLGDWKQDTARSAFAMERRGAFPKNTEIEAIEPFPSETPPRGAFAGLLPDGRTMSLRIHHTFVKLPEPGFAPRPLDPRIGFIPRRYFDHSARWN